MKRTQLPVESLCLVARAGEYQCVQEPLVGVGTVVRLNSGGPRMLVVDVNGDDVTVSWRTSEGVQETTLSRVCVHRCREI